MNRTSLSADLRSWYGDWLQVCLLLDGAVELQRRMRGDVFLAPFDRSEFDLAVSAQSIDQKNSGSTSPKETHHG
jgi:hypothetical protein